MDVFWYGCMHTHIYDQGYRWRDISVRWLCHSNASSTPWLKFYLIRITIGDKYKLMRSINLSQMEHMKKCQLENFLRQILIDLLTIRQHSWDPRVRDWVLYTRTHWRRNSRERPALIWSVCITEKWCIQCFIDSNFIW